MKILFDIPGQQVKENTITRVNTMFDFEYITSEEAAKIGVHGDSNNNRIHDVNYYKKLSEKEGTCENCSNPVWKLADTGLCFSCTTGETNASEDYELI